MIATSDRFAAAITGGHQLTTKATLIDADGNATELPILGGSVNLEATAGTRAGLSMSLAAGAYDLADLIPTGTGSLLAPYGNEIQVERGITFTDGTVETAPLGRFRLDETSIEDSGDDVPISITALDRSAIIIEAVFEEAGTITVGTGADDAIQDLILEVYPDCEFDFVDTAVTLPALTYEAGEDRWDFCQGCAEAAQCSLYFGPTGVLVMRPQPQIATADYTITEGEGGTLLGAGKRWSRENACNRVRVEGENASSDPVIGVAIDENPTSPTYYGGPFGQVTFPWSSPYITDADQAQSVAENILAQKLGTGQQISFNALVDPRLEPFDVVQVTRGRIGVDELHIIDGLSLPLTHDGDMTGQTRVARVVA